MSESKRVEQVAEAVNKQRICGPHVVSRYDLDLAKAAITAADATSQLKEVIESTNALLTSSFDNVERLQAQNERLRALIKATTDHAKKYHNTFDGGDFYVIRSQDYKAARAEVKTHE